jgi:hypothetical protein
MNFLLLIWINTSFAIYSNRFNILFEINDSGHNQRNWKDRRNSGSRYSILNKDIYRKRTDNICTLFAALFSLSLFVYCCMAWNTGKEILMKQMCTRPTFPAIAMAMSVELTTQATHSFISVISRIWFESNVTQTQRLCVSTCPSLQDSKLKCIPTSRIGCFRRPPLSPSAFRMYDTESSKCKVAGKVARIGHLCMPRDGKVR